MPTPIERLTTLLAALSDTLAAYDRLRALINRATLSPDPATALAVLALQLPQAGPPPTIPALILIESERLRAGAPKRRQAARRRARRMALGHAPAATPYLPSPPPAAAPYSPPNPPTAPAPAGAPGPQSPLPPNVAPAGSPATDLPLGPIEQFFINPLVKP